MDLVSRLRSVLCGLFLLGIAGTASANHVDFITDGAFDPIFANSGSGVVTDSQIGNSDNILGTEREVALSFDSGSGFVAAATTDGVVAGPGPANRDPSIGISFSNDAASLGTLDILLDGVGSVGLGGSDFDTMWNFLQVFFPSVDPGDGDLGGILSLTVTDTGANSATLSQAVDDAGAYFFAFPDFTGVDFSTVDSVLLSLETTGAGADFLIGEITREVVPEPGTGLLLGVGLTALGLRRRSQRGLAR